MRELRSLVAGTMLALATLTPVPATASSTGTENVNLSLPTGLDLTGHAFDPNGQPLGDATVGICPTTDNCYERAAASSPDGSFAVLGITPGTYYVRADAGGYVPVWLGAGNTSVTDPNAAVTIDINGNVSGIALQFEAGFSMSGTLLDPEGHGVPGIEVSLIGYGGGGGAITDANGHFLARGLTAGFYGVEVAPPVGSPFTGGWIYQGTIAHDGSSDSFEVDGDETGIDATLVVGRTISGTVTGLPHPADVSVSGTVHGRSLEIAPDGTFAATGLWPDELQQLYVSARYTGGFTAQFPYGVYDGTSNLNPDQSTAANIDVSGGDVTGLTLAVPVLPEVTGTVLDELGNPVVGFASLCSDDLGCSAFTFEPDGSFDFFNLPDSTYRMYVSTFNLTSGYVTASGGLSRDFNDAADIVVNGVSQVVDVEVAVGLHISGRITGPLGEPLEGASVAASKPDGEFIGGSITDANGDYVIGGLDAGDYRVSVGGPENGDYFSGYWSFSGFTDYDHSDLVPVPYDLTVVVSTSPLDGATGVSRSVAPTVTFSGGVSNAGAATIKLHVAGSTTLIKGTVTYNAGTHTATFTPKIKLHGRTTYVLEVSGILASGGSPVPPVSVTFTTRR